MEPASTLQQDTSIAAILIEPVQGEGGANAAPDGYLQGLRDAADEFGALVIADEVQTGIARTGKLLATDYEDARPDILVLGKALSCLLYTSDAADE